MSFKGSRVLAFVEVLFFIAVFFLFAWYFQVFNASYGWYSKIVMIVLGFIGIALHGRFRDYGLNFRNLWFSAKWSIYIVGLFALVDVLLIVFSLFLGISIILVSFETFLLDALWFFVFVGFAEELFFRGYIQSRLNEVFSREYHKILGVRFELHQGTLITAIVLFGPLHLLVGVNPFLGIYNVDLFIVLLALSASFLGVIFGVLREKSGDIILPSVFHGLIDFNVFFFRKIIGIMLSNIATMIALFIFFAIFFEKILSQSIN